VPDEAVSRDRLVRRLEEAVARPLTLVAAPPGAGKTMLMASWAVRHPGVSSVTWVTVDPRARTLPGLWGLLCAAAGRGTLKGPPPPTAEALAQRVADGLGVPRAGSHGPVALVLDDAHEADGPVLGGVLRALLALPACPRLVLSTRVDPALPLQRLRVEDRLAEVRRVDLAFTVPEAAELFARQGVDLTPDDVARLVDRTEGWAAGLRLAALMLAGHPEPSAAVADFAGDDRAVVGYLIEEVLDRQPHAARELLLRTAVLDRVSGPLADALTGGVGGQAALEGLVRRNAFVVPLDRRGRWFRFHALFGDLLRAQLARRGRDAVVEQHRRAARWFAAAGLSREALRHAGLSGDWDVLAGVLAEHWLTLRDDGAGADMDAALEPVPPRALGRRPQMALVAAARSFDRGDDERGEELLHAALAERGRLAAGRRAVLTRDAALLRLERARVRGDVRAGLRERAAAHSSIQELTDRDRHARAVAHLELGRLRSACGDELADAELRAAAELATAGRDRRTVCRADGERALMHAFAGRLREATLAADRALAAVEPADEPPAAHLARALVAAEQGNTLLAAGEHERASELTVQQPTPAGRLSAVQLELVRARLVRPGDTAAVAEALAALAAVAAGWRPPPFIAVQIDAARLRLQAWLDGGAGARDGADERGADGPPVLALASAVALLHGGATADAHTCAAPLAGAADGASPDPVSVGALAVTAAACDAEGDRGQAVRLAERALDLAEPEGIRLAIADAAPAIEPVLAHLLRYGTTHRSLIGEVLELARTGTTGGRGAAVAPLREELSVRELAVLRYLPTMLTSQEIAGELFVTLNTVKSHLKSIYRKLDADGRRDAVRRARQLGLVAPSGLAAEARPSQPPLPH
jgi:LuxR family maltose regulon positive regulatory protein